VGNLPLLTPRDQVKFVICSRADFDWAKASSPTSPARGLRRAVLAQRHAVAGTRTRRLDRRRKLPVRFQMQLHKLLWNDEPGR
jgi:7-carboxy-7-deazaguanine synthase